MKILDLLLTVLCMSIPVGMLVVIAIWGTRARLKYANRLQEALARGAFADMNTPENKSRFRRLAVFALIGLLGMISSLAVLVLQLGSKFADFYGITGIVALIFVVITFIAGFFIQREINRGL
jgi:hypothetical protein